MTFHGRRHTAASVMIVRGVALTIGARQPGHANPNITATSYAHPLDEAHLDRAAAVFDPPEVTRTVGEAVGESEIAS